MGTKLQSPPKHINMADEQQQEKHQEDMAEALAQQSQRLKRVAVAKPAVPTARPTGAFIVPPPRSVQTVLSQS
jgi:hypothetical protein